jgi:hypothetical protein
VGVQFTVTGETNKLVAVWMTNSLTPGGGLILSVDGFAEQFTDWGVAKDTDAAISPTDPAVGIVKDCLS